MIRLLALALKILARSRIARLALASAAGSLAAQARPADALVPAARAAGPGSSMSGDGSRLPGRRLPGDTAPLPVTGQSADGGAPSQAPPRKPRLPRVPRWLRWTVIIAIVVAIFRRAATWLLLTALSGALHLIGVNVHFPDVRFGWPWSGSSGSASNVIVGPWVLQKIEGIDSPALGTENYNFLFTHKVSKDIGPWPCWYQASFYAVGRASATVSLNPGTAWWKPATGHYQLKVTRVPAGKVPGTVTVSIALPYPRLPQSVHDITVDNTLSQPLNVDHSWTYPGLGCGVLIKPQFAQSVLYAQAQQVAFQRATTDPAVTQPMIGAAQAEATKIIRDNFIQPTVNALGYKLATFSIRWVAEP
jgi:hypothetical protein